MFGFAIMYNYSVNNNNFTNLTLVDQDISDQDVFVGIFYLILSLLLLIPYLACMLLMLTEKTMTSSSFYRMAISMGFADIMQILANGFAASYITLLHASDNFWLNNICSAFLGCGWMAGSFQAHLLAFNRFIHIYWPERIKYIFSTRNTALIIILLWTIGTIWYLIIVQPMFNLMYSLTSYSFLYYKTDASWYLLIVHTNFNGANIFGMMVWYGLIYRKVRSQLRGMQNTAVAKDKNKDLKMLLQSVLLCTMVTAATVSFTLCQYVSMTWWLSFLTNIIWLTAAGSNSIIHITLNSTLRARLIMSIRQCHFRFHTVAPSSNEAAEERTPKKDTLEMIQE